MMSPAQNPRICIIGAGPSGLTAIKNCLQAGLTNLTVYERQPEVGGNWLFRPDLSHSSVYETTHIISSKRLSQFDDFPMPASYPDYPSHTQVLRYFQDYAAHFGLLPHIHFNTAVDKAEPQPDGGWVITLEGGAQERFDTLIVANGHHSEPRMPSYPGTFSGQMLHSHAYKSAAPFAGQRVLVIGGGNSACDIAVETARVSAFTAISMRRGYYIAPKLIFGQPTDVLAMRFKWLPRPVYVASLGAALRLNVGDYASYGLQRPRHGVLAAHVTTNSELLYALRHGRVHARPDIARLDGRTVHFTDGTSEEYDTIIAATGFRITFPFLDPSILDMAEGQAPPLYLLMMHPDYPSLYIIGLVQPLGCIWPLADLQAKIAANAIAGRYRRPADMRQRIARDNAQRQRQFLQAKRHSVEVEYFPFRQRLLREVPPGAPAWQDAQPAASTAAPVSGPN